MKPLPFVLGLVIASSAVVALAADPPEPARTIDYNRDVRPILADNCFKCHGPDEKQRKAKLRLDTRDGFLTDTTNGKAVVPGHASKSEVIARITSQNPAEAMPPAKSGKKLTPEQLATLRAWIDQGVAWSGHWAFAKPVRPDVPKPKFPAANPIDAFVFARLEKEGLSPSHEADKVTLIRRVTLDLTGLPPTPKEVDTSSPTRVRTPTKKS